MSRARKAATWILTILVLLLAGAGAVLCVLCRDDPPVQADDLIRYRRDVPDAANGFLAVNIVWNDVAWPDDDASVSGSSEEFDVDAAREIVEKNGEVLKKIDRALDAPDFQVPEVTSASDRGLGGGWTPLVYAQSCKVRWLHETGQGSRALAEGLKLVRFGGRVIESQGFVIQFLVSCWYHETGTRSVLRCLDFEDLRPEDLSCALAELSRHPPSRKGLADAYCAEYVMMSNVVDGTAGESLDVLALVGLDGGWFTKHVHHPPLFLPEQTKRLLASSLRSLRHNAGEILAKRERLDLDAMAADGEPLKDAFSEHGIVNVLGRTFLGRILPTLERALGENDKLVWRHGALQLALALKLHKLEKGSLPDALEDLVPACLYAVPLDPYDGKPLRYSREKSIVYSVGLDLEDDGGSSEEKDTDALWDKNEPTVRLRF